MCLFATDKKQRFVSFYEIDKTVKSNEQTYLRIIQVSKGMEVLEVKDLLKLRSAYKYKILMTLPDFAQLVPQTLSI